MRSFTRIFSVLLLLLWMGLIFYMSDRPASESTQISGGVIEIIAERFYPDFEVMTEVERMEVVQSFQFAVRKTAHVLSFAALGFFAFLSFVTYTKLRFFTRDFWALFISLGYAAGDEFHQRFVPGRSCELRDFLLDAAGAVGMILLCTAFIKLIPPLRRKTAWQGTTKKQQKKNIDLQLQQELETAFSDNQLLKNRISQQDEAIQQLEISLAEKTAALVQIEAEGEKPPMQEKKTIKLSDELEFAAAIIGEAVIAATKACNQITAKSNDQSAKELVNLTLGRNEILKSEILRIINSDIPFEQKKRLILDEKSAAYDYFDSIVAQMC